jgi:hypothetical protein
MQSSYTNKQLLIASAMKRVLRPLIKLMLANDLSYNFAIDLLKTLFVEVADREFMLEGKKQTDTRISLISGVHRKDVRRLREHLPDVHEVIPDNISLGAQLIAVWNSEPIYLSAEGKPKALLRLSSGTDSDSFEGLVRSISKDIHPRAVLDELRRLGFVEVDGDDLVHLKSDAFIPQAGWEEKAFFFGHNLHDHAAAAVSNMMGQEPGYLERCVYYDGLSEASIQKIADLAKAQGMMTLNEVFKLADQQAKLDTNEKTKMRMTYGIYFYQAPMQTSTNEGGDQ